MGLFGKRSDVWYPEEKATDETENENTEVTDLGDTDEAIPTFTEGEITYSKLITAQDSAEAAVIKSILQAANIPYAVRDGEKEAWKRVVMGFNVFGDDFYVPTEMLDAAAALLIPDETVGNAEADGANSENTEEEPAGNDEENSGRGENDA